MSNYLCVLIYNLVKHTLWVPLPYNKKKKKGKNPYHNSFVTNSFLEARISSQNIPIFNDCIYIMKTCCRNTKDESCYGKIEEGLEEGRRTERGGGRLEEGGRRLEEEDD